MKSSKWSAARSQPSDALGEGATMAQENQDTKKTTFVGRVVQVIGPVVDVQFPEHHLPEIYNAVRITSEGFDVNPPLDIVAEVQQHLGEGRVRAVAMKATDGVVRGMTAEDE